MKRQFNINILPAVISQINVYSTNIMSIIPVILIRITQSLNQIIKEEYPTINSNIIYYIFEIRCSEYSVKFSLEIDNKLYIIRITPTIMTRPLFIKFCLYDYDIKDGDFMINLTEESKLEIVLTIQSYSKIYTFEESIIKKN
jgi:hypothetical protein